jgi:LuxR family maltose regulon positive regulatory protein
MSAPLLTTKFYIPPLAPDLVSRPRLVQRLNEGLTRKLTLIAAPAGFGKSTLLSEWIHSRDGRTEPLSFAWLSLDKGDSDPTRFLAYVVGALRTIRSLQEANVGASALATLQSSGIPGTAPTSAEALLTGLINEIVAIDPDPFSLILDDYHEITAQQVHDALAFLLENLPSQMHLVIATRADPPLPVARLRARRQLVELRQSDLRFTHEEATRLFNQLSEIEPAAEDVAALAVRTEGWIAGLHMAALALRANLQNEAASPATSPTPAEGPLTAEQFIRAFTGSDRYIMDYLVEEVLQRQSESVQTFLLHTSILNRLTAPLCDAVLANADLNSQEMLEFLERANLFLVPQDNQRQWYRYHRLFADLLRRRLELSHRGLVPSLHRRASAWHARNGLVTQGVDHALAGNDYECAADLIEGYAETAFMHSEMATLLRWVEDLPDDMVRGRPRLGVFYAGALLLDGHPLAAVEARLEQAERADIDGTYAGETAVFRAIVATLQGDIDQGAELSRQALTNLPQDRLYLRTIAANSLGITHMMRGNLPDATQAFDQVARLSEQAGNPIAAVAPLSNLAGLYMLQGELRQAEGLYRRALELAADQHGNTLPVAGKALMGLGELCREWNDLKAATQYVTKGIEFMRQYLEIGSILGYTTLALVEQARGDPKVARDLIELAEEMARDFDATEFDDIFVAAFKARLALMQGDLALAEHWVQERGFDGAAVPERIDPAFREMREFEFTTLARVYIAQGRADQALAVLDPSLHTAERMKRMRRALEILILQALALSVRGDTPDALIKLERALKLAEPDGHVRAFLDAGEPLAELLYEAMCQGIVPEYAGRLLAAFELPQVDGLGAAVVTPPSGPLIEPLSERELEVLRLIGDGLSNREIGQRLVISLSTVKGHTANIYGKLAVHSRTQAVTRARALGLM